MKNISTAALFLDNENGFVAMWHHGFLYKLLKFLFFFGGFSGDNKLIYLSKKIYIFGSDEIPPPKWTQKWVPESSILCQALFRVIAQA
jgi:hypothetical protein